MIFLISLDTITTKSWPLNQNISLFASFSAEFYNFKDQMTLLRLRDLTVEITLKVFLFVFKGFDRGNHTKYFHLMDLTVEIILNVCI